MFDYERTIILKVFSDCPNCGGNQTHIMAADEDRALLCSACGHEYQRNDANNPYIMATGSPVFSEEGLMAATRIIKDRLSQVASAIGDAN